jgi:hypothetical protein
LDVFGDVASLALARLKMEIVLREGSPQGQAWAAERIPKLDEALATHMVEPDGRPRIIRLRPNISSPSFDACVAMVGGKLAIISIGEETEGSKKAAAIRHRGTPEELNEITSKSVTYDQNSLLIKPPVEI